MAELVYPELSYLLVGLAYKVDNGLGYGHQEKYLQRAYEKELALNKIPYQREVVVDLVYGGEKIGKYRLDFIVANKIVVEFKVGVEPRQIHVKQVLEYLRVTGFKLAIIVCFTRSGVRFKRVVNPDAPISSH